VKVKRYIEELKVDTNFYLQPEGISLLHAATALGYTEIVRILVTRKDKDGKAVTINSGSKYGTSTTEDGITPLMDACVKDNLEIAEILVENGANVNATTEKNKTALLLAGTRHYSRIVKFLLENGADPNIKMNKMTTSPGMTALHAGTYSMDVVRLLVEKGADVNALMQNKDEHNGKTPLMIACEGNKKDIVKYLCEHGADPNITDRNGKKASDYTTDPQIKNDLMEGCTPVQPDQVAATLVTEGGRSRRRKTRNRRSRRHRTRNRRSSGIRNKRRTTPSYS
jgi:ankyrin repeat protein